MSASRRAALQLVAHLGHDWPLQPVSFGPFDDDPLPPRAAFAVQDETYGLLLPAQTDAEGRLWFQTALFADESRSFRPEPDRSPPSSDLQMEHEGSTLVLRNARMALAVPIGSADAPAEIPPPLLWMEGPEGLRRGRGGWDTTRPLRSFRGELVAEGPVFLEVRLTYTFDDDATYVIAWRLYADADVAIATERKTVADGGDWTFSLYEGFAPDTAHLGFGDGPTWPLAYAEGQHVCRHIYFNHYSLYQDFKDMSCLYRSDANRFGDAFGVFPVNGQAWEAPGSNILSLDTTADPDVRYRFSLSPGWRSFALFAIRRADLRVRRRSDFTYGARITGNLGVGVYARMARWSTVRLDDVKEMVLAWEAPEREWPFLHCTPERLASAEERIREDASTYGDLAENSALFNNHPHVVQKLKDAFLLTLERKRDDIIEFGPNSANVNPVMLRPLVHLPFDYEILKMRNAFSPEEDRKVRAILAFFAYFTNREDYYFGRRSLLPEGHPEYIMHLYKGMRSENFGTDRYIGVGMYGLLFPEHPDAETWRQLAFDLFDLQMQELVAESGAWCEGWNYYCWSLYLLVNFAHAARQAGHDLFAHPKFKAMIRFVIESVSPPNPAYDNKRIDPCFGSYGEEGGGHRFGPLLARAATGYADADPAFASECMWAAEAFDQGILYKSSPDAYEAAMALLNTDASIPPRKPVLESKGCPGFGALFRHAHEDGTESYLIARASPYWPHQHTDPGSFFLYHRNAPLITEAGRGRNRANPFVDHHAFAHNIVVFDGKPPMQYVWPCRQDLVRFHASEGLEYAVLDCRQDELIVPGGASRGHGDNETVAPHIRHYRHILFIKPDLFIVHDTVDATVPSEARYWCLAETVTCEDGVARFRGRHGMDLDLIVVQPEAPTFETQEVLDTWGVRFGAPAGEGYTVVFAPCPVGAPRELACTWDGDCLVIREAGRVRRLVRRANGEFPHTYDFVLQGPK